jgi:hypothetical protein
MEKTKPVEDYGQSTVVDVDYMNVVRLQPVQERRACSRKGHGIQRHETKCSKTILRNPGSIRFLAPVPAIHEILSYVGGGQILIDTPYSDGNSAASVIVRIYDTYVDHAGQN